MISYQSLLLSTPVLNDYCYYIDSSNVTLIKWIGIMLVFANPVL